MSQEQQANKPQTAASPVIIWEQKAAHTRDSNNKIVSIDDYRRNDLADSEATVSMRDLSTSSGESVRLRIVSSGFGQKPSFSSHTVQNLAA